MFFLDKLLQQHNIIILTKDQIHKFTLNRYIIFSVLFILFCTLSVFLYLTYAVFSYKNLVKEQSLQLGSFRQKNIDLKYQVSDLQTNLVTVNQYLNSTKNKFRDNKKRVKEQNSLRLNKKSNVKLGAKIGAKNKTIQILSEDKNINAPLKKALLRSNIGNSNLQNDLIDPIEYNHDKVHAVYDVVSNTQEVIERMEKVLGLIGLHFDGKNLIYYNSKILKNNNISHISVNDKPDDKHNDEYKNLTSVANSDFKNQGGPFEQYIMINGNYSSGLSYKVNGFNQNIAKLIQLQKIINSLPLWYPMKNYQITSYFGKRVDPIRNTYAYHGGVDFATSYRGLVYASGSGKVIKASRKGSYGIVVEIDHGYGIITRYAHLSKTLVKEGKYVKAGTRIGRQGMTGRVTGPHLHYEIIHNNKHLNPMKFLKAGNYVAK